MYVSYRQSLGIGMLFYGLAGLVVGCASVAHAQDAYWDNRVPAVSPADETTTQTVSGPVLYDFCASWCGPCQSMKPTIAALQKAGWPVQSIDVDQQKELAARFRVSSYPTFVMVVDGKEVSRVTGTQSQEALIVMFPKAKPEKKYQPQALGPPLPDFLEFKPLRQPVDSSVLADIDSHLPANSDYVNRAEPINWGHEGTHGIASEIRQSKGQFYNGFYCLKNRAVVFREPHIKKSDVAQRVPAELRGKIFALYMGGMTEWENEPLYVLDEWTAYTNGATVGFQGIPNPSVRSFPNDVSSALEFTGYANTLLATIDELDPTYQDRDKLQRFVAWNTARVLNLADLARKTPGAYEERQTQLCSLLDQAFAAKPETLVAECAFRNRKWVLPRLFNPPLIPYRPGVAKAQKSKSFTPTEATYRINTDGGAGTGVAIGANWVVTNSHVVGHKQSQAGEIHVFKPTGATPVAADPQADFQGQCLYADPSKDLALIYIPAGGLQYADVAASDPSVGDKVTAVGFGKHAILRQGKGSIQAVGVSDSHNRVANLQTRIDIEPGDSGSGMFNQASELVGVNWGSNDGPQGDEVAIPASEVNTFLATYEKETGLFCRGGGCSGGSCSGGSCGGGVFIGGPRGGGISIGGGSSRPPMVPVQPSTPNIPSSPIITPGEPTAPPLPAEPAQPIVGPAGPQGPPGPGVDPAILAKLQAALDAPITFNILDASGKIKQTAQAKLGGKLDLKLVPVPIQPLTAAK